MSARRDALFLSIRHAPMNKMRPKGTCGSGRLRFIIGVTVPKGAHIMAWTTPVLVEICVGLEINGYLPPEF
jgi:coenzyme PQQ precursor peptide PqqA